MSIAVHVIVAFISGVAIEALYAFGVIVIGERKRVAAAISSVLWGVGVLVGVHEAFKIWIAAALWCLGLGVGTLIGMHFAPKEEDAQP